MVITGYSNPNITTIITSIRCILCLQDGESSQSLVLNGKVKLRNKWRRWKHQNPTKQEYKSCTINPVVYKHTKSYTMQIVWYSEHACVLMYAHVHVLMYAHVHVLMYAWVRCVCTIMWPGVGKQSIWTPTKPYILHNKSHFSSGT